jgi:uncharacterized protein (DUF2235 family)
VTALNAYRESIPDMNSLVAVERHEGWGLAPVSIVTRLAGLAAGLGVKASVRDTYWQLSRLYDGPENNIFLFGFSRGAFTVRALAGLLHRCGLPRTDVAHCAALFEDAWRLYEGFLEPELELREFRRRRGQRDCSIHFLGLWDTVMSYGGLIQRTFPHLRHNAIARIVRHALALYEDRSWFQVRPWGLLDVDQVVGAADSDRVHYASQDIREVWFCGSHSDVGGIGMQELSTNIALRWMVCEAEAAGIGLNEEGMSILADPPVLTAVDPSEVTTRRSSPGLWRLSDYVPRWEIDNAGRFPTRRLTWGKTGRRRPSDLSRGKRVFLCLR